MKRVSSGDLLLGKVDEIHCVHPSLCLMAIEGILVIGKLEGMVLSGLSCIKMP